MRDQSALSIQAENDGPEWLSAAKTWRPSGVALGQALTLLGRPWRGDRITVSLCRPHTTTSTGYFVLLFHTLLTQQPLTFPCLHRKKGDNETISRNGASFTRCLKRCLCVMLFVGTDAAYCTSVVRSGTLILGRRAQSL